MFFDCPRTESDRAQYGGMTGRVIAQAENEIWVHRCKGEKDLEFYEPEILSAASVVRVALHQHKLMRYWQYGADGALNVAEIGGTRREEYRLPLPRDVLERFDPGDVAGADLVRGNVLIEHVHCLEIIWRRKEMDAGLVTGS